MTNPYANHADTFKRLQLIDLMRRFHCGKKKAAKKSDLIEELWGTEAANDKTYNSRYDRSLRMMIEEINNEGGVICSDSTHGYWWAESIDDGLPAAESNLARAFTQKNNAERLIDNLKREYGGQLGLFQ